MASDQVTLPESKQCNVCDKVKPASSYALQKSRSGDQQLNWRCKVCERDYRNYLYHFVLKTRPKIEVQSKVCSHCKIEKPASEYNKKQSTKDGLYYQCRECYSKTRKS